MSLIVKESGLYTSVQDLGRYGYLQQGLPSSGALDFRSHILVNSLLGNKSNASTIEMTYVGAQFTVMEPNYICVVGADMGFSINGIEMPMGKVVKTMQDDVITFGKAQQGMRAYLGIAGGFLTESILGSQSTHEKIQISRHLKVGDTILSKQTHTPKENVRLKSIDEDKKIRIISGQQYHYFREEEIQKFLSHPYKISSQFDRMGFRLDGEQLKSERGYDILSEPTMLGSIQIPADGKPIILLNERQTVGGYPKIATVIKADIPKLVQLQPGEPFTFHLVELKKAKQHYEELMERLNNNHFTETVRLARHIETERIKKYLK